MTAPAMLSRRFEMTMAHGASNECLDKFCVICQGVRLLVDFHSSCDSGLFTPSYYCYSIEGIIPSLLTVYLNSFSIQQLLVNQMSYHLLNLWSIS
jgi:hypothetical protein